jgi:thioredoxin-like negative regulator of GroEL
MATPGIVISRGKESDFIVRRGTQKAELSFQQVFSLGHSLFQSGHYARAQDVFAVLGRVRGRGPRAKIMLARCKAEIESFEACSQILQTIFEGEQEPIAEELQGAFVFHTMGMQNDAIREMVKAVREYPDFPTALLCLGDLYLEKGDHAKATYCWKLAIKRDRNGGAIAVSAQKQLKRLNARIKKAKTKMATKRKAKARRKPVE